MHIIIIITISNYNDACRHTVMTPSIHQPGTPEPPPSELLALGLDVGGCLVGLSVRHY